MGTIGKVCCDCVHYQHGNTEDPCRKGQRNCGYLHPGCWRWKSEDGKEVEMPTKVCSICGMELTIDNFYMKKNTMDGYSSACKSCFSHKERIKQMKEKKKRKEASIADMTRGVKICNLCGKELPLTQFGNHARTKDGLQPLCNECKGKQMAKAHKARKERNENRTDRC